MLTRAGRICLIDFGIARLYRPGWKDTSPLGTVGYAAPEQYGRGAHTTPQSDIYGLGATLQTLLTGKEPLEILQDGIPPKRARALPTDLQTYLAHMLERDATRRPHTMAEVKQALQQIKAQRPAQKIKAAGAFLRGLRKEISGVSFLFLLLLLFFDLLSFDLLPMAEGWPPLWLLSLLLVAALAIIRSIFALRQVREERSSKLPAGETITIVWRQLVSSAPAAFLLTCYFFFFRFYYVNTTSISTLDLPYNPLVDLVALGVIACGGIIAGLVWLIRWLLHQRASRRLAWQQQPQKLEHPLAQQVHNRPRP